MIKHCKFLLLLLCHKKWCKYVHMIHIRRIYISIYVCCDQLQLAHVCRQSIWRLGSKNFLMFEAIKIMKTEVLKSKTKLHALKFTFIQKD